jgi:uncharacterized protein (DUF2235 family)
MAKQEIVCLEFLQNEFAQFPTYVVLLYKYGKSVIKSKQTRYYGSGMGILQEAERMSVETRKGKALVSSHISRFSSTLGDIMKRWELWIKQGLRLRQRMGS